MARRDTARLAAMSDPARNRWFRCPWTLPPPGERKSPGAPTPGQIFDNLSTGNHSIELAKSQARSAAKALFAPGGVA